MRALPQMFRLEGGEQPVQKVERVATLCLDREYGETVHGDITPETERYFRRLATAADQLADAIGKALAARHGKPSEVQP